MYKRRQVRLAYPQSYAELALLLAKKHGVRASARALALPFSTFYAWRKRYGHLADGELHLDEEAYAAKVATLVATCEAYGFRLRERVPELVPRFRAGGVQDGIPDTRVVRAVFAPRVPRSPLATDALALSSDKELRVARARQEIDTRYYARLTCASLGRIAGMSRFNFIRAFSALFGISPHQYLMQVRIRHAKRLLETSHQPLNAIATAVGYESHACLCKAFRSVEGVSLARYYHGVHLGSGMPLHHRANAAAQPPELLAAL